MSECFSFTLSCVYNAQLIVFSFKRRRGYFDRKIWSLRSIDPHPKESLDSPMMDLSSFARLVRSMGFVGPLLDQCCPATIFTLRSVSSDLRRRVDWYCQIAFNINTLLESTYFCDARRFRRMQDETQSVISGSFALQFFACSAFSAGDLDLYCYKHAVRVTLFPFLDIFSFLFRLYFLFPYTV